MRGRERITFHNKQSHSAWLSTKRDGPRMKRHILRKKYQEIGERKHSLRQKDRDEKVGKDNTL